MDSIDSGAQRNPNLNVDYAPTPQGPWSKNFTGDTTLVGPRSDSWWTGKRPVYGECPGVLPNGKITSLPLPHLEKPSRQAVLDYFDNTWTITEVLFSALQGEEAFYRPPYHQLRHPFVFYYTHPAAVYINKFRVAGLLAGPLNAEYEQLFETGVDEMSWDDISKNDGSWPPIKDCTEYRRAVYKIVRNILETIPELNGENTVTQTDPLWAAFLGFEHERIHIETTSVLMREAPLSLLRHPEQWPDNHPSSASAGTFPPPAFSNGWVSQPAQEVSIGRGSIADSFGWDNEFGLSRISVPEFQAQEFLCTNSEYYPFVQSGAYNVEKYWTKSGWSWRTYRNVKWPTFWVADGPQGLHKYKLRTLMEVIDMPWAWPVVVNMHEAKAYCNWLAEKDNKPYRLPTEAEVIAMRDSSTSDATRGPFRDPVISLRGCDFPTATPYPANLNLAYSSEGDVNALAPASTKLYDTMGNLWVWCEDAFAPLNGFKVHPHYEDFSTPCFDGKHFIIKGGSFISTGNEASIWARFHFRPHFFQHAGFRVICGEGGWGSQGRAPLLEETRETTYESENIVNIYLNKHYASMNEICDFPSIFPSLTEPFAAAAARITLEACKTYGVATSSALEVGCAVGRTAFELAREFQHVLALDLSEGFIQAAQHLQEHGSLQYQRVDEGDLKTTLTAAVDHTIERSRVHFRVADACSLPPDLPTYSAVVLADLLCSLPSPKSCLGRMGGVKGVVAKGGILVIFSPFSWAETFTPKESWIGGFVDASGAPVRSSDELSRVLGAEFELLSTSDVPMLLREHARKYQITVLHCAILRRKL